MTAHKLLLASLSLALGSIGFGQTIFTDNFTAGNTNNWISSAAGNVTFSSGVMTVGAADSNGYAALQLSNAITIEQGETLFFSLQFTTPAAVSATTNAFRLAMINTDTTLVNGTNPNITGSGYALFFNNKIGTSGGTLNSGQFIYERVPETAGSLLTVAGPWGTVKSGSNNDIVNGGLEVNTLYTLTFSATRNADDSVDVKSTFTDGALVNATVSWRDETGVFTFNTFAIAGSTIRPLAVDNVTISVSAIPEPSTYAMIFGGLALGFVVWRRKRSR